MSQQRDVILKAFSFAIREYVRRGAFKTEGAFNRHLWDAALGFYRGDIDAFAFIDAFISNIGEQLTRAWNEGARSVDVSPEDMDDRDAEHLQAIIDNEYEHVLGLAEAIEAARMDGITLDQFRVRFRARIDLWSNRYNEVVSEARVWFGGKARLEWVRGPTSDGCDECIALNGIVAWATEWDQSLVRPQHAPNDLISCGGWHCLCELTPTTRRRTPRALETILNIVMSKG